MHDDKQVEKYIKLLESSDEQKRVEAANSLQQINHPLAIEACIKTINDGEDILHLDYTPSVHCLIKIGEPALPKLFELLMNDYDMTRLRAMKAIERITLEIWKKEFQNNEDEALKSWSKWWEEIDYNYEAPVNTRMKSTNRFKKWMTNRIEKTKH